MGNSVYEIVTERIMTQLEQGVIPWRQPWTSHRAVNWKTQKPYRGINAFLLQSGEYATWKQIQEAGGKVKKGAKSQIVVLWKWIEVEDKDTHETEKIPFMRYYTVFEINTQVEGLQSKREAESFEHDSIGACERIVEEYPEKPEIRFASDRAYYRPSADFISVPPLNDYKVSEEFYSTLFHEMVHSTGHEKRLKREGITHLDKFGSPQYAREELIAEMGAAMLCARARIDNTTVENSAAYIASWLRTLKDDKRLVVTAASQAQKAADHILGEAFEDIPADEQTTAAQDDSQVTA